MTGHAFQLSYEDILKVSSSVFFGKGRSSSKRWTVIGLPPPIGFLQGENNLQPLT